MAKTRISEGASQREKCTDVRHRTSFEEKLTSGLSSQQTSTLSSMTPSVSDHPPPLHFAWSWKPVILYITFLAFCNLIIPILLFYPLKNFTKLSTREIVGIASAGLGISSCIDSPLRLWRLTRHRSTYGPLGSDVWWYCDFVMWTYTFALLCFAIPLAIAPSMQLYDFFLTCTILLVGPFGVVFLFSLFRPKLFCRCSSDPAGVKMKPAIYYFFEDVGSVDFKLGRKFRKEINTRWDASPPFQKMITQLTLGWVFSIVFYCAITAAVTWSTDLDFAFGWVLGQFFMWLIISIIGSFIWTKWSLEVERQWWSSCGHDVEHHLEKTGATDPNGDVRT